MTELIEFSAIKGEVLGITTYRGFGVLSDISKISRADIFDQRNNPTGTQRDLNVKHARAAYSYVLENDQAFWPEVVLCCRDPKVLTFKEIDPKIGSGKLTVDLDKILALDKKGQIAISRIDGNHRLHFASGDGENLQPLHRQASFCILMDLDQDEEIQLFRDINNNQRRMNTSHLDTITTRLTPEQRLMLENPALFIAKQLGDDKESPFYERVYEGGKKQRDLHIPLRNLNSGIQYLRQRSIKIEQLKDIEAEYLFIRNYWQAVRKWVPGAWEDPKKYILLRGAGLWGACILGGNVIDRCLDKGKYTTDDMLEILESGREWDWTTNGDFKGYSGRGGAVEIANKITSEFSTESEVSMKKLAEKIKSGN